MGYYFDFILACSLKTDLPKDVADVIAYLFIDRLPGRKGPIIPKFEDLSPPNHPFFKMQGWHNLFKGMTAHFPHIIHSILEVEDQKQTISARCSIDQCELVDSFCDWIKPYVLKGSGARDIYGIIIGEDMAEPELYSLK